MHSASTSFFNNPYFYVMAPIKGLSADTYKTDVSKPVVFLLVLFLTVLTWIVMAEVGQQLQHVYPKPFFITLIVHAFYACFVPLAQLLKCYQPTSSEKVSGKHAASTFLWAHLYQSSIPLSMISFLSGWFWYISLPHTSVSGNSAIFQSSPITIFILSMFFLHEIVTRRKVAAVTICIVGVILVCLFGEYRVKNVDIDALSQPTVSGYIFCLLSMLLYALFEVLFKKWNNVNESIHCSMQVLGLLGCFTILFCTPFLLAFDLFNVETFKLPDKAALQLLLLLSVLDSIFNFFLFVLISMSSPLITAVGCLLVLPASIVWDAFVNQHLLNAIGLAGVACILFGISFFAAGENSSSSKVYNKLEENTFLEVPHLSDDDDLLMANEDTEADDLLLGYNGTKINTEMSRLKSDTADLLNGNFSNVFLLRSLRISDSLPSLGNTTLSSSTSLSLATQADVCDCSNSATFPDAESASLGQSDVYCISELPRNANTAFLSSSGATS